MKKRGETVCKRTKTPNSNNKSGVSPNRKKAELTRWSKLGYSYKIIEV